MTSARDGLEGVARARESRPLLVRVGKGHQRYVDCTDCSFAKGWGDLVLPFRVGIGAVLEKLLRPDASGKELRKALRRYAYSAAYVYASAQPDACRHEINGEAVEPVRELDRVNAC